MLTTYLVNAQDTLGINLRKLAEMKLACERLGIDPYSFQKSNPQTRRDSAYHNYATLIKKIKQSPKLYLNYIDKATRKNSKSLARERILYKHPGIRSTFDPDSYFIKTIDLYRIVKYSLFTQNEDFLPKDFQNLGIVDPKNYYGYYEPEPELRSAKRFILKSFHLTLLEKEFIDNKLNVKFIMDIKNFLDTWGMSDENKKFIKSAIATFVKDRGTSLSALYSQYLLSKDVQNYVPRDRDLQ